MSHYKPNAEQPETRSQRRMYDHRMGPAKNYVYTLLSALDVTIGQAWREELRSMHGN